MKTTYRRTNFNDSENWDKEAEIEFAKFQDSAGKKNVLPYTGRPIGGYFPVDQHWIKLDGPKEDKNFKAKSFPKWCCAADPDSDKKDRSWKALEMCDAITLLLERKKYKTKRETIDKAYKFRLVVTPPPQLDEIQKIIIANNCDPRRKLNPYMLSYEYRVDGKGVDIIISGCVGHELGYMDTRYIAFFINRDKQRRKDPQYVDIFQLTYSCYRSLNQLEALSGSPIVDPKYGEDVQIIYNSKEVPANKYSTYRDKKTKLTKTEIQECFGKFLVKLNKKDLKLTGMSKQDLTNFGFKPSKKSNVYIANMGLHTIWEICRTEIVWSDDEGLLSSKKVRFIGEAPVKITEKEAPLVYDLDMLFYPSSPDEIAEGYRRCGYLDSDDESDPKSASISDYDLDDDDEPVGVLKKKKKATPKKMKGNRDEKPRKKKSKKVSAYDPDEKKKKIQKQPKRDRPVPRKKKASKKCRHPKSSYGNFIGDATCLKCKYKADCSSESD